MGCEESEGCVSELARQWCCKDYSAAALVVAACTTGAGVVCFAALLSGPLFFTVFPLGAFAATFFTAVFLWEVSLSLPL